MLGSATATPPVGAALRVVLVGCVKTKRDTPSVAKDLYRSALWRGRRSYAERSRCPWYILSGLHGLVPPEERLEPYNLALADLSRAQRRAWGERVAADLRAEVGVWPGREFEIHAGALYSGALAPRLRSLGAVVSLPVAGLPLGMQLQWYGRGSQ